MMNRPHGSPSALHVRRMSYPDAPTGISLTIYGVHDRQIDGDIL